VLAGLHGGIHWPADRYELVVVADNCSDGTAAEAAPHATVLVRNDPDKRGKGHALAWAAARLGQWPRAFDAVVIIDADTSVNPGLFAGFQDTLDRTGSPLAQALNLVGNAHAGWRPALISAGFAAMNAVRPAGRDVLGCSAGLMGTGMCYARDFFVGRRYDSGGLAEDLEEGMRYRLEGLRTRLSFDSEVRSPMPVQAANAGSQRERWEGGRRAVARAWLPKMAAAWLRRPDRVRFDGFMELAIPPLGQFAAFILFMGAAARVAWHAGMAHWICAIWAGGLLLALVGHVLVGLALTGSPASVYGRLLAAPFYVAWKLAYRLGKALRRDPRKNEWVRTAREVPPGTGGDGPPAP